jgi:hypothetical protein
MVVTTGGPLRYISEAPSILASKLDLDKVNMKPTPTSTAAASSAGRPLSRAVAIVRTGVQGGS